ncbi:helix-turn-helix transcriptional regulator [Leuconostoc gasicomitatum]|uniref:helix-turn-helix domain-containing protein n=1 Tax=Leuconostoc gasicomitatum TaxID=115778 RepID=UPI000BC87081|nr:helix-turn-helix transcriptional regulator [Leuconostoc gasicomitatum]MBZ5944963.1 helix-turn-helix transcriptional regulator [Leuconostoc gasicomitatum]MBZ5945776.1 helix-turn-helix transcriptional regulator [Leuconostoc gasicomitatum]MBZ5950068.1 helix-turn-helix transcriptional regulator [Leuconostoc gasicomitatum]MBZ5952239.1 helix-turn-helix transcriptional regulator [Leuconostoc gasicomitatum]MBZ5968711.1 helix-turn-helix transcriptional regulator [Leuconostoc gasicomitatum]
MKYLELDLKGENFQVIEKDQLALIYGGDLGAALKYYRESAGLTERELALKMNITPAALSNYERNKRRPDLEFIKDISNQLHFSVDKLLENI